MEGGEDGTEGRDKKRGREGGRGGSREREESGKCTFFFFVVGAHARAIVCLRVLTSKLVLSNGNKTSE